MADSTITVVGNLTRDPELRFTNGGRGTASFGMAVSRRYQVNNEWQETDLVLQRRRLGHPRRERRGVAEQGPPHHRHRSPRTAQYETKEGEKRNVVEIMADEIGPRCVGPGPGREDRPRQRSRWRLGGGARAVAAWRQQQRPTAPDPVYGDEEPF